MSRLEAGLAFPNGPAGSLRVPPDPASPGLARRWLVDLLAEHSRSEQLELVVLCASELVTNAVVHAGTEAVISVTLSPGSVTVAVRDAHPALFRPPAGGPGDLAEGGRGLLLVDGLADSWGVSRLPDSKVVWFSLGPVIAPDEFTPVVPATAPGPTPARRRLRQLRLNVDPAIAGQLTLEEEVGEIVARLLDALDVDGAQLQLDEPAFLLTKGRLSDGQPTLRVPVGLRGRQLGVLSVQQPVEGQFTVEDHDLVRLAASGIALAVGTAESAAQEAARHGWAGFLAEASDLLAGPLEVERILSVLCSCAIARLASWAAAVVTDEEARPGPVVVAHEDEASAVQVRELLAELAPPWYLATSGREVDVVALPGKETGIAVSLRSAGRQRGRLLLVRAANRPFRPDEINAVLDLSRRASLAIANAQLFAEQAKAAAALQAGLLPPDLPRGAALDFAACYHPARDGLSVGGDFYDVFAVSEADWIVAIGDVCGKGAEAAAVTGVVRDVLRLLLRQGHGLADSLRMVNDTLLQQGRRSRFCTAAVARFRPAGDEGWQVSLCSAGHPLPLRVGQDGLVRTFGTPGTLLGVLDNHELQLTETESVLGRGEALTFYTDGIVDRQRAGELFGEHGLTAVLEGCLGLDAATIAGRIEKAAAVFTTEPLRDDMAVLVVRARLNSQVPAPRGTRFAQPAS